MEGVEVELGLASAVMLRLFDNYYTENRDKFGGNNEKGPVLMPVTRKGYWLFRLLYDNREKYDKGGVLENFTIQSDRYAGKILNGKKEYEGKYILLYDDIFNTGDNMFEHYVTLRKWGAHVTPVAYRYVEGYKSTRDSADDPDSTKWLYFQEKYAGTYNDGDACRKEYEEYLDKFYDDIERNPERHLISKSDRALFNINIMQLMERDICPMVIDLPIFKAKGRNERFIRLSTQAWSKLTDAHAVWKFVRNISEEAEGFKVNASFFDVPQDVKDIFPGCFVRDCVVKAKYQETGDEVKLALVPFAILNSVSYANLIHCFCRLYKGSDRYYNHVTEGLGIETADDLLAGMGSNENLFRAVYRAVVLYFSNYIGMKFEEYLSQILGDDIELEYDKEFMKHHIPQELADSIDDMKSAGIECAERRIRDIRQWEPDNILGYTDEGVGESTEYITPKDIYDHMKCKVSKYKFDKNRRNKPITYEEIEEDLIQKTALSDKERQEELTKIILLFLEGSIFGNNLKNRPDRNIVLRGFLPGENSTILLGKTVKLMFPYIYAFYRNRTAEEYTEKYDEFTDLLKSYFERKRYFDYLCTRYGFDQFALYFRYDGNLPRKIEDNVFLIRDYLEGKNSDCEEAFMLVDKWKVG